MKITWFDDLTNTVCTPEEPGAFILKEESLPLDGAAVKRVTLTLKPGEPPRSLRVYYRIAHVPGSGVRCWNSTFKEGEHTLDEMLSPEFRKKFHEAHLRGNRLRVWEGENFYRWAGLVHAAEFIPGKSCGWYAALEPENPNGIMWFSCQDDGFVMADSCRYIDHGSPVVSRMLLFENCADWRPPLGWFHDHYPEYFRPVDDRVRALAGTFCITNPLSSEKTLADAEKNGVCFTELHNHYPAYGNFVPQEKSWKSVVLHDYPDLPFPRDEITPEKINGFISRLHARNIKVLFYFQATGDCYRPFAEKNFPEDIALELDGTRIPAWRECWMMNGLPGSRYAKHIDGMLEELFLRHPDIDGIFMDQVCYPVEDTGHDDGKTGYANRRIANVRESYYPVIEKAARMLHARGKILWVNGSFDLKVQRFADGIMAEGLHGGSEVLRYFCLDKPLLVHQYPETAEQAAMILSYALRAGTTLISVGGNSHSSDAVLAPEPAEIFRRGRSLLEPLRGRKWCFLPRPAEFPDGVFGNVFHASDGETMLVTLASQDALLPDGGSRELAFSWNLAGVWEAACLSLGGSVPLADVTQGRVTVPAFDGLALVKLRLKGEA
ncbi:MAG: hypothetical protein IJS01_00630 [Lentisphaeria bacterium]|nr:hypothetical protein [Lentisphaeria bacterium]